MTGSYYPSKTTCEQKKNNDIILTIDTEDYTDIFFGREIDNKFYFARSQMVSKNPDIDYYCEFFFTGEILL